MSDQTKSATTDHVGVFEIRFDEVFFQPGEDVLSYSARTRLRSFLGQPKKADLLSLTLALPGGLRARDDRYRVTVERVIQ